MNKLKLANLQNNVDYSGAHCNSAIAITGGVVIVVIAVFTHNHPTPTPGHPVQ